MRGLFLGLAGLGILMLVAEVRAASDIELPPGPDRDLVYGQCRTCHDLQSLVDSAGIPRNSWAAVLDDMRRYGLRLAPDQQDKILEYLAVYLGPNPPPATAAAAPPGASPADGQTVYSQNCAACHQPDGKGLAGRFPPLAGNPDLFLDRLLPVYVVLNGLAGELTVAGRQFRSTMPPLDHLSDAGIAAVVNHVRHAWGNDALRPPAMADIDAAAVAQARQKPMTPSEVLAYRAEHQ